ncbi:MAG: hypothetical protein NUW00_04350 [Candidatus Kaiserbacteria bacterium]|nr:hypothetical protein [Candidatus Kaiserbacteria bacterium]
MSYKSVLTDAKEAEEKVTVDRADAPSLSGFVESVDEHAVTIKATSDGAGGASFTHIEFTSIRGVTTSGWDMDAIAN